MYRPVVVFIACCLLAVSVWADDSLPVIEVKADRTTIYPQRMDLTGEESLLDVLQMVPDLMIAGYEELIDDYNLRIDNCPLNGDARLILSQMKAKDIAKIQVCDNTGVAKGTVGMSNVLDINMMMPGTVKGFVEAQGGFGRDLEGDAAANVLYGSRRTDLYANASYRYQQPYEKSNAHKEYVSLHMTNRFDDRNKLLTYLTQQYLATPDEYSQKVMGRARYFHTFNEAGTELLLVGGYQYASDPVYSNQLPLFIVELNTPLPAKRLSMMLGVEGDYLMTRLKGTGRHWDVFNHDIYLQFTYSLPRWRFTVGNRVMFYNYRLMEIGAVQKHSDIRNNTNACVICVPSSRHQIQLGYYRKYINPAYQTLFADAGTLTDEQWAMTKGLLEERDINQIKLSYAYTRQRLTVQTDASYYFIDGDDDYTALGASAYWRTNWVTLTGGTNIYIAPSRVFASLRVAPTAYLPRNWQIGLQLVYYTPQSPMRYLYGTPVYGCLSVNKQIGDYLSLGVDWHDMFDSFCSAAKVNRHAAHIRVQYRF
ncbi:MAG: hypothetical protein J5823_04085 [Paludibacteraceae bacterium]|nr:hypothetical protein [Paludibacteraceae bacterium]